MSELPLIARARAHDQRVAFRSGDSEWTYQQLLDQSARIAGHLLVGEDGVSREDLRDDRVAYLSTAGIEYTSIQWGIWRAGGVALPLSLSATTSEWEYALTDSQTSCVVATGAFADRIRPLCESLSLRLVVPDDAPDQSESPKLPIVQGDRPAMILFTSGTTNKPKGVVTTHDTITAQITALVDAWKWQADDSIPLFLPLHHIHGIINVMSCALWSGATIEPFAKFSMDQILDRVSSGAYSVFMAVPTIYVMLIQTLEGLPKADRAPAVAGFANMRLMISGSAALPASVHQQWTSLTTQKLLERYGMTEIGMGLSNPYDGERKPGMVGQPLPGVQIRLKSESGDVITEDNEPGEIQVRGPNVFREYFNRPEATANSFDDGWFRSGDIAVRKDGYYRIMGRQSVDIIKSGGYKLSALEIEAALLDHPAIKECAVVGLPDDTWGEIVAAATVLGKNTSLTLEQLREWCSNRVSKYKMPTRLLAVDSLPRNAMGKVTKPAVTKLF